MSAQPLRSDVLAVLRAPAIALEDCVRVDALVGDAELVDAVADASTAKAVLADVDDESVFQEPITTETASSSSSMACLCVFPLLQTLSSSYFL